MKSIVNLSIILGISNVFITPLYSSLVSKKDIEDELEIARGALTTVREESAQLAALDADHRNLGHRGYRLQFDLLSNLPGTPQDTAIMLAVQRV